jgi:hypothetical protein
MSAFANGLQSAAPDQDQSTQGAAAQPAAPDQAQPAQPQPEQEQEQSAGPAQPAPAQTPAPSVPAHDIANRAEQGANGQKTGMFKNILIGALKGLATGGVPGAIEGGINPKVANQHYANKQQLANTQVDQAKANVASTIADAAYKHAAAENFPAELKEKIAEGGRQFALNMKAYGISPMLVTASDSPEHLQAAVHQLLGDGRQPIIVPVGNGQYAAYDLAGAANTPADLPSVNLDRAMNGAQPYTPDAWMSKMIGPQGRMQAMKHAQDFTHPTAKSLPEFDDKIARYQSYLDAVKSGKVVGLDDPKKATDTMQTALDTLVSGHNQLMADLIKQRQAFAQTRFIKLTFSDGSERVMTGPEAVAFTRGSNVLVKDAAPVAGQASPTSPASPASSNQPHAVNPSFSTAMLQAETPDGKQVAGSPAELQAAGIDPSKATKQGQTEQFSVRAARRLTGPNELFSRINDELNILNKSGKLTLTGARVNDFLLGKVGTGPEYVPLRNNLKLLSTTLQQIHVGNRGSDTLYDEFKKMWDSSTMDYPTLRSALSAGFEYASDRAMRIPPAQQPRK